MQINGDEVGKRSDRRTESANISTVEEPGGKCWRLLSELREQHSDRHVGNHLAEQQAGDEGGQR